MRHWKQCGSWNEDDRYFWCGATQRKKEVVEILLVDRSGRSGGSGSAVTGRGMGHRIEQDHIDIEALHTSPFKFTLEKKTISRPKGYWDSGTVRHEN